MDSRKNCKGCSTVVVKPIICDICGVSSHPGCIARTGHPYANGQFQDCRKNTSSLVEADLSGDGLVSQIQVVIRGEFEKFRIEFDNFRSEVLEICRADLAIIKNDIQCLTERIERVESELSTRSPSVGPSDAEEIIIELEDRKSRSMNLIFHQLEEPESSQGHNTVDTDLVSEIIQKIWPGNTLGLKCMRIGKKREGYTRPVRVTLPSKNDALKILRNKSCYSGPVKIYNDQTNNQRKYLKSLQERLKNLRDAGEVDKTIRYFNGTPKIVTAKNNHNTKNSNTPL